MKILMLIKNIYNEIVHQKSQTTINFNINKYINLKKDKNNNEYEEEEKDNNELNVINDKEFNSKEENPNIIPISKIAKFIAYGKGNHSSIIKFKSLWQKL